jgi:hypothetical protein
VTRAESRRFSAGSSMSARSLRRGGLGTVDAEVSCEGQSRLRRWARLRTPSCWKLRSPRPRFARFFSTTRGSVRKARSLSFPPQWGQVSTSKTKTRLRSCRDPSPDRVAEATSLRSVAAQEYLRRGRGWHVASVGSAASGGRRGCWQSISVSVSSVSVSSSGSGRGSGTRAHRTMVRWDPAAIAEGGGGSEDPVVGGEVYAGSRIPAGGRRRPPSRAGPRTSRCRIPDCGGSSATTGRCRTRTARGRGRRRRAPARAGRCGPTPRSANSKFRASAGRGRR